MSVGDCRVDRDRGAQFLDAFVQLAREHERAAKCKPRIKLLRISRSRDLEKRQRALCVAFREVKIAERKRGAWIFRCATQDFE